MHKDNLSHQKYLRCTRYLVPVPTGWMAGYPAIFIFWLNTCTRQKRRQQPIFKPDILGIEYQELKVL